VWVGFLPTFFETALKLRYSSANKRLEMIRQPGDIQRDIDRAKNNQERDQLYRELSQSQAHWDRIRLIGALG